MLTTQSGNPNHPQWFVGTSHPRHNSLHKNQHHHQHHQTKCKPRHTPAQHDNFAHDSISRSHTRTSKRRLHTSTGPIDTTHQVKVTRAPTNSLKTPNPIPKAAIITMLNQTMKRVFPTSKNEASCSLRQVAAWLEESFLDPHIRGLVSIRTIYGWYGIMSIRYIISVKQQESQLYVPSVMRKDLFMEKI